MKFDWRQFAEADFYRYAHNASQYDDWVGAVHIGDICIDLLIEDDNLLTYDFYVAHEDTGYGYKNDIPYDYADGDAMEMPYDLSYDEFRVKAEELFTKYINAYRGNYSLVEHACRPLEIW